MQTSFSLELRVNRDVTYIKVQGRHGKTHVKKPTAFDSCVHAVTVSGAAGTWKSEVKNQVGTDDKVRPRNRFAS